MSLMTSGSYLPIIHTISTVCTFKYRYKINLKFIKECYFPDFEPLKTLPPTGLIGPVGAGSGAGAGARAG